MKTIVLFVSFSLTSVLLLSTTLSIILQRQEVNPAANIKTHSTSPSPLAVPTAEIVLYSTLPEPTLSPQMAFDYTYNGFGIILTGTTQDVLATSSAAQTPTPSPSP